MNVILERFKRTSAVNTFVIKKKKKKNKKKKKRNVDQNLLNVASLINNN